MSLHQLRATHRLPLSLDEAWSFFSDPRNLALITPPWLGFVVRTSDLPVRMYPGLIIDYTVRPVGGLPLGWVTEITHVQDRAFFVDEQRRGPYALWHHEHHFAAIPGGVEMQDIVSYALPFGPVGDLVNVFVVRKKVAEIFRYRAVVLDDRFGAYSAPAPAGASPGRRRGAAAVTDPLG